MRGRESILRVALPGDEAAAVLAEDLDPSEAPSEPLALQGIEGKRHDSHAVGAVDVDALVAGREDAHRGFGVLGDAPFVPASDVVEHRAP